MAIQLNNPDHLSTLQQAVRRNFEHSAPARQERKKLIEVYKDKPSWYDDMDVKRRRTLINTFQQFVRGHVQAVAYTTPKWSVKARIPAAKGLDTRIKHLLNRFNDLLGMRSLIQLWGLDSAFGYAAAKTKEGIAPKGVHSAVSPRSYRIPPNYLILDQSAPHPDQASFIADFYLVPLNEAQNHPGFNPDGRVNLSQWRENSSESMLPGDGMDTQIFAEPMTRLIDVYIPTSGLLITWACDSDQFEEIASAPPLRIQTTPVNPYSIVSFLIAPDELTEMSMLSHLKPLHDLANDSLNLAADQTRTSKRNPIFKMGTEDMAHFLSAPPNEAIGVDDPKNLGLFELPGPDPSLVSMGGLALQYFSQYGGNIEVALGQAPGAKTARQTQAMLGQIQAVQSLVRSRFEEFLSDIGMKQATLALLSETLALENEVQVPGTDFTVNWGWAPPHLLPRTAGVTDFKFEVVPQSTSLRSEQDHLGQLNQASQMVMQWMMAAAQGAPINMQAVMADVGEAFDLVPHLPAWWSGEQATPREKAANTYTSLSPNTGQSQREITYDGAGGGGEQGPPAPRPGGLQQPGGVQ